MTAGLRAPATDAAAALLTRLVSRGVRHVVVSPGSCSQALALCADELARRGRVQVHVRTDERVAAFVALGIGRETGMPAVVICTSGSAVAHVLPAVLEAHHAGVPLLCVTADRPPSWRGVGANQVTDQPSVFDSFVRWRTECFTPEDTDDTLDGRQTQALFAVADTAIVAACGPDGVAGPVHINVPFTEPLSGAMPPWVDNAVVPQDLPTRNFAEPSVLAPGLRTVVVAGADSPLEAEAVARAAGWPLIAEIVSGCRFGPNVIAGYREALADPELGGRIQRVVVYGHPTLSRESAALLKRRDCEIIAVRGPGEQLNLNGATRAVSQVGTPLPEGDTVWLEQWARFSRQASGRAVEGAHRDLSGLLSEQPQQQQEALRQQGQFLNTEIDRPMLVDALWRATWPHDRLVFGSSRLVRVADRFLAGKKVPVHANRGLSGIDGTVSTAMGVAVAAHGANGAPGVTRVLLGDLAFLHDVGGLFLSPDEPLPRLQVIVGNDGGGTIFDDLEVAQTASREAMDRVMYTPHNVQVSALAEAYGWRYIRVTTRAELDQALSDTVALPMMCEVVLPREMS